MQSSTEPTMTKIACTIRDNEGNTERKEIKADKVWICKPKSTTGLGAGGICIAAKGDYFVLVQIDAKKEPDARSHGQKALVAAGVGLYWVVGKPERRDDMRL
jgi:hypothetical protein